RCNSVHFGLDLAPYSRSHGVIVWRWHVLSHWCDTVLDCRVNVEVRAPCVAFLPQDGRESAVSRAPLLKEATVSRDEPDCTACSEVKRRLPDEGVLELLVFRAVWWGFTVNAIECGMHMLQRYGHALD